MVTLDPLTPQIGVIGCLLAAPELVGQVMARVRAEDFRSDRCRLIYQAITGAFLEGKHVDAFIVRDRLAGFGDFTADLVQIVEQTVTTANIWEYVDMLKKQSALEALQDVGHALADVTSLDDAMALVDKAHAVFSSRPGVRRLSAKALVQDFCDRHGEGKHSEYYSWSLRKLDEGLYSERGDMIILGGYPSAGKTALSLRFAWHMAASHRVGFYSLETKPEKLGDRSIATLAEIDMKLIKRSELTEDLWRRFAARTDDIAKRTIDFIPAGGMTVADIRADALSHRYEVIYIDYLQLIAAPRAYNRTEAVTSISIGLHQLAQGNDITVVALSQLRRPESSKKGEEMAPDMSSLRESGQLEQDADTIMLLYRETPDDPMSRRVLKVAKNKEGVIGKIYLDFDGATQSFSESDNTREVAQHYQDEGRKAKQSARLQREQDRGQVKLTEITGGDNGDLPF